MFQRNYDTDRLVRNEVVPGAEWVLAGEGVATRKWDGSCCMIRGGRFYRRYNLKPEGRLRPPLGFEAAEPANEKTGITPGWVQVLDGPENKWFLAARANSPVTLDDGTYEAVGPHFGGGDHTANPEGFHGDSLLRHGVDIMYDFPRTFSEIEDFFRSMTPNGPHRSIEGVVWHHSDGRMVKIKARDFGVRRGISGARA